MARFGIQTQDIQLGGELYQQQGVVDQSAATAINSIAAQVRPIATQIQSRGLANDLEEIEQDFEGQLTPQAEDQANPAVQGFQAELQRLNAARSRISETQYEARKNAALKARINQTPGLADALNRTASQFDSLNEYSLVNQAIAAQETAQSGYEDMVKFGVEKLGLPPTWVHNPDMVKYAEVRSRQRMEAAANQDIKTGYELMKAELGANKELDARERELNSRIVGNELSGRIVDFANQGLNITVGQGDDAILVNAMDASQVGALSPEQRLGLVRELKTQLLNEQAVLQAQINDGTLDPALVAPHVDNLVKTYNQMIGFAGLEDDAQFVTNENTILSRSNLAAQRSVTALDMQYQATSLTYNLEELDRTRALEIQQKENDLIQGLVVSGASSRMLENPAVLRWKVLNTLGLVDSKSADAQLFLDQLAEGGIGNEREAALQTGDFSAWQQHMSDKTGLYRRMRVDLGTPASAAVVAEDVQATIAQVQKAVKDPLRPMSMDEVADIMNIFASDNYGQLVGQFSDQFGDVGVEMEEVVAPVIARDFVTKATNLYAQQGVDFTPMLELKDGKFMMGGVPNVGRLSTADDAVTRIVKGLNNTAMALVNTQNITLEEASRKVVGMIPQERMLNLIDRSIRNPVRVNSLVEYQAKEADVRDAFNNLYGEGAYRNFEVNKYTSQGYAEVGPAPNGGGTIYQNTDGDRVVIGD